MFVREVKIPITVKLTAMFTEEGSGVASGYTGYVGAYGPGQLGGPPSRGENFN